MALPLTRSAGVAGGHPASQGGQQAGRGARLRPWLRWGSVALLCGLLVLDLAFPPPLPRSGDTSTLVVARDGTPLRAFADRAGVWRYPASVDSVSPLYLQALLTYEDRWFWHHPGVNPVALARAVRQWLEQGRVVSGGSTLTMQVARLLDPHSRTPWGKARQLLRALQLEARLDKREILRLYLERAPFGGTIEGVEAASWAYLGKPAAQLSHAEAALLAVLPQAPSRLRPDRHPEAARAARDKVLDRMAGQAAWTPAQVLDARVEAVVARQLQPPMHAPLLAERLRRERPGASRIMSTLDAGLQRTLEDRVGAYFSGLPPRTSAAILVVDNASMEARAYVGSLLLTDAARLGHVDMVRAWRSPGSTLKPFLYALALEDGLVHSHSLLVDAPQSFGGYRPGNFDAAFKGPVSATEALQLSLNVPAVDLLDRVGPARFAGRLANGGIRLRQGAGAAPNLSLILGGTGARLEDLVGAFAAFNRDGIAGQVRYTHGAEAIDRRLMSPGAAWIVRDMLEANPRPGYARDTFDLAGRPKVAWKTGTSYGFRDAWALGGTPTHTVGVWVGRPDGTPLPGQYGAITALPLMFQVIDSLPGAHRTAPLPPPSTVARQEICWPLGVQPDPRAPQLCQRRMQAWSLDGVVPPTFAERDARLWSAGRQVFQRDEHTGLRLSAECSAQHQPVHHEIASWPALAAPWLAAATREMSSLPPLAPDCVDDQRQGLEELRIEGINDLATIARAPGGGQGPRLSVRVVGGSGAVQWLLDGRWIAQTRGSAAFVRAFDQPGDHELTALADSGAWSRVRFRVLD